MGGIYISNMEMPKDYSVIVKIFPDGKVGTIPYVQWFKVELIDGVQAVPVPQHERLGDLDELWVEINKICDRRDAGIISDLTCLQQILSVVRHTPTIIPADRPNVETEIQQEYLQNWHEEGE